MILFNTIKKPLFSNTNSLVSPPLRLALFLVRLCFFFKVWKEDKTQLYCVAAGQEVPLWLPEFYLSLTLRSSPLTNSLLYCLSTGNLAPYFAVFPGQFLMAASRYRKKLLLSWSCSSSTSNSAYQGLKLQLFDAQRRSTCTDMSLGQLAAVA